MKSLIHFIQTHLDEIGEQTLEHLWLTLVSLIIAVIIGLGIGIWLTRKKKLAPSVLGFVGMIQTIPSLALLGFMIPLLGIGVVPAIVALFLYALLPIVRNTYTGIDEVDPSVKEAALGMGMTDGQILTKVELPLAVPVIFAGIRTAVVISVGLATLCALIAAGGLGEFIFRGIALNNVNMIIAGALPAALLALTLDGLLGQAQKHIFKLIKPLVVATGILFIGMVAYNIAKAWSSNDFVGGFPSEFIERSDGYKGLAAHYGLELETVELETGLMYQALRNKDVDLISGFSTDGRIAAYDLRVLDDDQNYFPPYQVAALVRGATLRKYADIGPALELLAGRLSDSLMTHLNYQVDQDQRSPKSVAHEYLQANHLIGTQKEDKEKEPIVIGSKNFTENIILAEMFALLIESHAGLPVEKKLGFGATKLLFDGLKGADIDLYPEYTGTGLLVLLQPPDSVSQSLMGSSRAVYDYVVRKSKEDFDLQWLSPLGFNNTHALMMREEQADELNLKTISDLKTYLDNQVP